MYASFFVQVPDALRNLAERNIDQAEKALRGFLEVARKSLGTMQSRSLPASFSDLSRKSLDLTENNMRATFEHARKLALAKDLSEVLQLQNEFVKNRLAAFQVTQLEQRVDAKPGEPTSSALGMSGSNSSTDTIVTSPAADVGINTFNADLADAKASARKPKRDMSAPKRTSVAPG